MDSKPNDGSAPTTQLAEKPEQEHASSPSPTSVPGLPRPSWRAVFEIYVEALKQTDTLDEDTSFDDLPTFNQAYLHHRVTDYGNARSLFVTWGLIRDSGNLDADFVDTVRQAEESKEFEDLREFLRNQLLTGYENLISNAGHQYNPAILDKLGEKGFDLKCLEYLSGIVDEVDTDKKAKRTKCLEAVHYLIRHCGERAVLEKEAKPKAQDAKTKDPGRRDDNPPRRDAEPDAILEYARKKGQRIDQRSFHMLDESHQYVKAEVYFSVPKTSYWIAQLGTKLLDWADQLREQEEDQEEK